MAVLTIVPGRVPGPRRAAPVAGAALIAAISLWGASSADAAGRAVPAAVASPAIYVQGDSLTVDSAAILRGLVQPAIATIDAKIGRHTYEGVELIRRKLSTMPRTVVVALGTNDDWDAYGVSVFRRHVASIMSMLGGRRCVIWTTIYQKPKPPKKGKPAPPMVFAGLNTVIEETAAAWRNVRRVPWAELSAANPAWYAYDSIHPTTAGYQARAEATRAAIRRCPAWTQVGGAVQQAAGSNGGVSPT